MNTVPPAWTRAACITDSPILASVISSYFNSPGVYFPVIAGPRMARHDWENEIVRKRNTCSLLRAETVILAAPGPGVAESFARRLNDVELIIVNSLEEWNDHVRRVGMAIPHETVVCQPSEILWGLLLAKRLGHRLEVAGAESIQERVDRTSRSPHCVMVDDFRGVTPVIAANYAFAVEADARGLPSIDFDEIDAIYDRISESQNQADPTRRTRASNDVTRQGERFTADIPIQGLRFITFITRGAPYGYFIQQIPTTHLYSHLDLGRHIADSIYYAGVVKDTRLSLVIDPGLLTDSESPDVVDFFRANRIQVKEISGRSANGRNVRNYIRYYPYDFLYICTHAGEISKGQRFTINFTTSTGDHVLVVDVIHTFILAEPRPGEEPKVEVDQFMRFVEMDGVAWTDQEGKERIGAGDTLKAFMEIPEDEWKVADRRKTDTIRDFAVIEATDGPVPLVSEYFAGSGLARPIVFNNACSSLHQLSPWAILAGARGYVGTVASVGNTTAKEVARAFFELLSDDSSLPVVLWRVQQENISDPLERVYLHFGCHFSLVRSPRVDVSSYPRVALGQEIEGWEQYLAAEHLEEFKEDVRRILAFVHRALREETPEA